MTSCSKGMENEVREVRTSRTTFCCLFKTVTPIWGPKLREENYASNGIAMDFVCLFVCTYPDLWVLSPPPHLLLGLWNVDPVMCSGNWPFRCRQHRLLWHTYSLLPPPWSLLVSEALHHITEKAWERLWLPVFVLFTRLTLLLEMWLVSICLLKYRNVATELLFPPPHKTVKAMT